MLAARSRAAQGPQPRPQLLEQCEELRSLVVVEPTDQGLETGRVRGGDLAGERATAPRQPHLQRPPIAGVAVARDEAVARQSVEQRRDRGALLTVEVGANGRPTSVALKRSSGVESLDRAALAAVRRWTFEPARSAGIPVASRVEVPVRFSLSEGR